MGGGLLLPRIPAAAGNSNAVIRQEFRKLRFQMIDDTGQATSPEPPGSLGILALFSPD